MGGIYDDQNYKNLMNANYYPLENMKKSVARLKASKQIDIETMEYGQYQPILSPLETWPNGSGKVWFKALGHARLQLTAQPNTTPLSNDERVVVPPTKCALLDASIRKCFNSEPPIPMKADITQHQQDDVNSDQHEIRLVWEYGNGEDQAPTLLNLTMVCPYTTKSRKADASAEVRQEHSAR
ncbi:hypothetical protein TSA1_03545 [Bradyrhizobium nitroreducens]|uniref:Uncharacterized protein n=1 Tax=Bradyrhizobium nitroreducens TaxID=709803 RepID=A0A2M6U5S4_9BRAD|nr:hypothetical protein [Bradyrhizobium nitroreducens]PIS99933.1 hypothetical protein TSA1_03545 [Bradyrhizobium nitroreducens]